MTQNPTLHDWTGQPVDAMPECIQVGASAFVLNAEGKLLMQQREDNRHWAMPGGRMDPGENISQTAIREMFEETGFHVRIRRLIGIYSDPMQFMIAHYRNGEVVQMFNACFECEIVGGKMRLSNESVDIGFFPFNALPEPVLLTHRIRIQDALVHSPMAFVR